MIDDLLGLVAPHHCFGCGKTGTILCQNCKYDIASEPFAGCIVCARPSLVSICEQCKTTYQKAWCVGDRAGILEQLINVYKFERVKRAAGELGTLLDATLPILPTNTIVVPVPTVQNHVRVRGYDHSLLLAREFARQRNLTVKQLVLRSNAASQRGLHKKERMKEAKRAFYCKVELESSVPYLIIDDVVTTNATLRYAAGALRSAGAKTVWVAVIARQPLDKQR